MIGMLIAFLVGIAIGGLIETYRVQVRWKIPIGKTWNPPKSGHQ